MATVSHHFYPTDYGWPLGPVSTIGIPMTNARRAGVLFASAAILALTACGGPSAESNSKEVADKLLARDEVAALKLMTPEQQRRARGLSGGDILGNSSRMTPECTLGDPTSSAGESGTTVTFTPMKCPDGEFTIKMIVMDESKLIDRVTYDSKN